MAAIFNLRGIFSTSAVRKVSVIVSLTLNIVGIEYSQSVAICCMGSIPKCWGVRHTTSPFTGGSFSGCYISRKIKYAPRANKATDYDTLLVLMPVGLQNKLYMLGSFLDLWNLIVTRGIFFSFFFFDTSHCKLQIFKKNSEGRDQYPISITRSR